MYYAINKKREKKPWHNESERTKELCEKNPAFWSALQVVKDYAKREEEDYDEFLRSM